MPLNVGTLNAPIVDALPTTARNGELVMLSNTLYYRHSGTWYQLASTATPPFADLAYTATGSINVADSTETVVQLDTIRESSGPAGQVSLSNNRYVCQSGWAGLYHCVYGVDWNSLGGGNRSEFLFRNGVVVPESGNRHNPVGGGGTTGGGHMTSRSMYVRLAVGDYLQVGAWQNSGGLFGYDHAILQVAWVRK